MLKQISRIALIILCANLYVFSVEPFFMSGFCLDSKEEILLHDVKVSDENLEQIEKMTEKEKVYLYQFH